MNSIKSLIEHSKPDERNIIGLITNALISCVTVTLVTVFFVSLIK